MHACLVDLMSHTGIPNEETTTPKKRLKSGTPGLDIKNAQLFPLSVAYKLHLEMSHMISLFDWLQAFVERMENCGLDELSEDKRQLLQ